MIVKTRFIGLDLRSIKDLRGSFLARLIYSMLEPMQVKAVIVLPLTPGAHAHFPPHFLKLHSVTIDARRRWHYPYADINETTAQMGRRKG